MPVNLRITLPGAIPAPAPALEHLAGGHLAERALAARLEETEDERTDREVIMQCVAGGRPTAVRQEEGAVTWRLA
jgi:hypothetical protein